MWGYRKRVERDLAKWHAAGWVSDSGQAAITSDLARSARGIGLPQSLAILAAVLIGFAVMSFVGANWQYMPRALRLGLLLTTMWAAYIGAGVLFSRGLTAFGHAAVLLGASVFGASIMLISQMYHMDGNPPDAVLAWAVGTLIAGIALRSNPTLAFAMILMALWGGMEASMQKGVFWPFLLGWAPVAAAFYWQRWAPGVHLASVTLTAFLISLGYTLNEGHAHALVVLIGLAVAAVAIVGEKSVPDLSGLWPGMLGYGVLIAFSGLFALQFVESPDLGTLIVLALLTLVMLIGAIWWGLASGNRGALWLGYIGFSIEIIGVYSKTFGTLMNTSLFFLSVGLLFAALAYFAYRLHARQETQEVAS